ncbi:hypothetical protein ACP70R_023002 [Stipagrostis hirtigluma subsp. patula]
MDPIPTLWTQTTAMPESQAPAPSQSPGPSKRPRHGQAPVAPLLPEDVIAEQILTRVPAAATVRFRAVCRAWRAALASDHFVRAHHAIRAAAQPRPEIVFFAPAAANPTATAFYSFKLPLTTTQRNGSSSGEAPAVASARELVTVEDLRAGDLALCGTKPCHGLTLLFQPRASAYHVCNLSTGEHVSLPPCALATGEIPRTAHVFSSAGLGFDPVAGEHKVVRLYEDRDQMQQRCEVYGLRSGEWRPCAGQVPPHAAKGLDGSPPVFLDGCFYWHIDSWKNFDGWEATWFRTPEPILSLSVATEQFGWVRPPEERAESVTSLVELDGSLCAVVDARLGSEVYELWTRRTAASSGPWTLRCRISLATLPAPTRDDMGRGIRMLPLGSSPGEKTILLATSRHMVYAYDPESGSVDRVFSMQEFVDTPGEARLLLNVALHEESVAGVRHRPAAGDGGQLKMKLGSNTVAKREGPVAQYRDEFDITPKSVQLMLAIAMAHYNGIVNMHN